MSAPALTPHVHLSPVCRPADDAGLEEFLTSSRFPFHGVPAPSRDQVRARIREGAFDAPANRAFWILASEERVGLGVLEDLEDDTPMVDLRLAATARGRGLGAPALRALSDELFTSHPRARRFEGTTRADNLAMRRTFERAGWTQEARYREAWEVEGGDPMDAVGYAILRREWAASS